MDFVKGAAPTLESLADDQATTGEKIEVTGTRLLVKVAVDDGWAETAGGIVAPTRKTARALARVDRSGPPAMIDDDTDKQLERGTVVGLGQGRYNQMTGSFAGCAYREGAVVLFRRSDRYGGMIDDVPGRGDLLIIQEDMVRCLLVPQEANHE